MVLASRPIVTSMKPEEQRIAIAEARGWSGPFGMFSHCASGKQLLTSRSNTLHGTPPEAKGKPEDECSYKPVPDYLNDLNAMHEAEKVLTTRAQISQYVWELERLTNWKADYIVGSDGKQYLCPASYFCCVNATAAQRAEAFLRTLNLWKP